MSSPLSILLIVVLLLALTALYVAAEFATVSARRARLTSLSLRTIVPATLCAFTA